MKRRADIVCGGFPCQDLSVAGKRAGLAGERSGLFHEFIRIVRELQPALVVIENVPGLVSSERGHDFRIVLDSLQECGALDIAWRTLDSRYFDLAQRRERLFFVADFRGQRAGEILIERPCGCGHPPEGSKEESGTAVSVTPSARRAGGNRSSEQFALYQETGQEFWREGLPSCEEHDGKEAQSLVTFRCADFRTGMFAETDVSAPLTENHDRTRGTPLVFNPHRTLEKDGSVSEGFKPDVVTDALHGPTGNKEPLIVYGIRSHNGCAKKDHAKETDTANASGAYAPGQGGTVVAFHERRREGGRQTETQDDLAFCLGSFHEKGGGRHQNVATAMGLRRLMPVEGLRLQGFPDDWLDLDPPLADGTKYRMIGNAVSVPVAQWLGRRILAAYPKLKTYLSVFAGISGFDLGFNRAGLRCVGQIEKDKHCLRLLAARWPDVPKHDDVRTFPKKGRR